MDLNNHGAQLFLVELELDLTGFDQTGGDCIICCRKIGRKDIKITRLTKLEDRKGYFPGSWYHTECYLSDLQENPPSCGPFLTSIDEIDGLDLLQLQNSKKHLWLKNKMVSMASAQTNVPSKRSRIYTLEPPNYKYSNQIIQMTMKDDFVMDSNALWQGKELQKTTHILRDNGKLYGETLCRVDVSSGCNSFYKVQVLESDAVNRRSWGRIGELNEIRYVCEMITSKQQAVGEFERLIIDLKKLQYSIMDIDYGEVTKISSKPTFKLEAQVEKFIRKIFDVPPESFTFDFKMDVKKSPLGQVSQAQLSKAYQILAKLTDLVDEQESKNGDPNEKTFYRKVVNLMNSYLTLVPRQFSVDEPPILKTSELVQAEVENLENLMELDLHLQFSPEESKIEKLYKELQCDIVVVARGSELWTVLEKYLFNTLLPNVEWTLTLDNIYSVARRGEYELFSKSQHVGNRKLLWHGSPTANIKSILSNGLGLPQKYGQNDNGGPDRATIFFADMAAKSTTYCQPTSGNNNGALLLSEVALGTLGRKQHSYTPFVNNTPGSSYNLVERDVIPDPNDFHTLPNGTGSSVVVPWGKPISRSGQDLSVPIYGQSQSDEYIVYYKTQVNIQFLLEVTFNYKQPASRKN